ncbi:MAG TPA: serine racemase VanT catalytic subunit [Lachnospiraceae bacterium]|nr:serine racemase VanT catalytic subunit [Lachnospiraceae bacterium]
MYEKGRAWIELNKENLRHNVRLFQKFLPESTALMPAVKANAYGHGDILISKELQKLGISHFCVACAEEGVRLRRAGIKGEILVLGYTHPENFDLLREYCLTQTIVDYAYGETMAAYGKELTVHIGIDTGMHRLGESSDHISRICRLWEFENLKITGVYSHLCTSDGETEAEQAFVKLQERRFLRAVQYLKDSVNAEFSTHLQGSYGILNKKLLSGNYDYARVGIALYGALSEPSQSLEQKFDLRPVLSLKARIGCVREVSQGEGAGYGLAWHAPSFRKIAAVSIGYADGIPRALSNKGHALVRGKKVPIVGRICMDQLLLDVTEVPEAVSGDEAVLIGKSRDAEIKAQEMAVEAGTISNEILSRMGERVRRIAV